MSRGEGERAPDHTAQARGQLARWVRRPPPWRTPTPSSHSLWDGADNARGRQAGQGETQRKLAAKAEGMTCARERRRGCDYHWGAALWKVNVKVAQLCPTLCDPMDYAVHGILQARVLE